MVDHEHFDHGRQAAPDPTYAMCTEGLGEASAPATIRVVVAAEHTLARAVLRDIFRELGGFTVIGESRAEPPALHALMQAPADILLCDLEHRPPVHQVLEILQHARPGLGIVLTSAGTEARALVQWVLAGRGRACLHRAAAVEHMRTALWRVSRQGSFLCPGLEARPHEPDLPEPPSSRASLDALTPRERTVMTLCAEGLTTIAIAGALGVSRYTVRTHRRNLMDKLELYNTAQVARTAVELGLVQADRRRRG